ncbi:chorismate synthase [Candidatus Roizmanbacteria bacterium CG22_combo_CG10-13_8_21_14_all_35_9]|uniref:Chorismate synthase n=1 Tax=Candidatus Roizmanbacteria bacterium CG22_combo_CG10-13_8_21_14_all_35_9 TaxID=1974861 RepID=A0A2H0BZZ6_9BACT|nr:MAG: chorismate synthase [Candidatus Roizmanbacteria bacterium CG22_combo_CG10-13_8_21_14_all_35_9]
MMNTFGQLFRVTSFGESHGGVVGCVVDGCPPNLKISIEDIQKDLDRRRPGQSKITSPRKEEDKIEILSGVFEGKTTGTPILLLAWNKDARPEDYKKLKNIFRPGHADLTYAVKYGIRDWQGGGRASARETLARVAAGAIAKKFLKEKLRIEFLAYIEQVGEIKTKDKKITKEMIELIEKVGREGDSVGGVIRGMIKNVPIGLGEPVFDKLSADLGKAMLSIPAVKGFEIGSGFEGVKMRGSQHNDEFFIDKQGRIRTRTNNAGGILGGISNGETIHFRVAFKPVSTIKKKQKTIDINKKEVELEATGRHDPCVLPRAVPIVEAMAALVIMDHYLRHKAQNL